MGKFYWNITTKYSKSDDRNFLKHEILITKDKWIKVVSNDHELIWDADIPHTEEYWSESGKAKVYKYRFAHFDLYEKHGFGRLRFTFFEEKGYIFCDSKRINPKHIQKMCDVAKALNCVLFNHRKRVEGEYLEKLILKYTRKKK